jgi:hypothetical protein
MEFKLYVTEIRTRDKAGSDPVYTVYLKNPDVGAMTLDFEEDPHAKFPKGSPVNVLLNVQQKTLPESLEAS